MQKPHNKLNKIYAKIQQIVEVWQEKLLILQKKGVFGLLSVSEFRLVLFKINDSPVHHLLRLIHGA